MFLYAYFPFFSLKKHAGQGAGKLGDIIIPRVVHIILFLYCGSLAGVPTEDKNVC